MAVEVINDKSKDSQDFLASKYREANQDLQAAFTKNYELVSTATHNSLNFALANAPQTPNQGTNSPPPFYYVFILYYVSFNSNFTELCTEDIVNHTKIAFANVPSSSIYFYSNTRFLFWADTPIPLSNTPMAQYSAYPATPSLQSTSAPVSLMHEISPPNSLALRDITESTTSISTRKSTRTAAKKGKENEEEPAPKNKSTHKAKPKILSEEQKATMAKLRVFFLLHVHN